MQLEFHVTVKCNDVSKFVEDCKEIGVKPIIIETEKGEIFDNQVMTSSTNNNIHNINEICYLLERKNYQILRKKVEKKPEKLKDPHFIYYETHFRLKLDKNFDRSNLVSLCKKHNFHLSRNLFKKDETFNYQMITYRSYKDSLRKFKAVINKMKKQLIELNIDFDKIEIEECIFDSNISIDNKWL
ncbi:MAG TPA: hypothetical protein VFV86_06405 [Nitrososphaeraceae archaeon]|nr:hypothetical protein [Nitrososphaeraceae archaeon]